MTTQDLIPSISAHTEKLLDTARSLTDQGAPTLCEGWTEGSTSAPSAPRRR